MSGDLDLPGRTIIDTFAEYGFQATKTGLWFARDLLYEEAEFVARVASGAIDMGKWWLGSLMLASEGMWGQDYAQLSAITNRSPEGLMNIASVARRVPEEIRREGLSFSHHEVVASLSRDRQIFWLDFAEKNRLAVHELRPYVKAEKEQLETTHDVVSQSEPEPVIEPKPAVSRRARAIVEPSSSQAQIEQPSLRTIAAAIVAMPRDDHDQVCLDRNVLERLRAALGEEPS